jgi:hypothetical protein
LGTSRRTAYTRFAARLGQRQAGRQAGWLAGWRSALRQQVFQHTGISHGRSGQFVGVASRPDGIGFGHFSVHGVQLFLRSDNRPEFVSHAILDWIATSGIGTALIDPGKPWQNGTH